MHMWKGVYNWSADSAKCVTITNCIPIIGVQIVDSVFNTRCTFVHSCETPFFMQNVFFQRDPFYEEAMKEATVNTP